MELAFRVRCSAHSPGPPTGHGRRPRPAWCSGCGTCGPRSGSSTPTYIAADPVAGAGLVAVAVAATTAGGMFFCVLRVKSDSTVAPIVTHTATISLGILAAAITR